VGRVVGGDVTNGPERWSPVVAGADPGAPAVVVGAVATGGPVVVVSPAVVDVDGTDRVTCDVLRPGAARPAATANSPAPATARATTARVMRFKRRSARSRAETRRCSGRCLRSRGAGTPFAAIIGGIAPMLASTA